MALSFTDMFNEISDYAPTLAVPDAFSLINNAIGFLNSKNFVHETEENLQIDSNGEYDLTNLSTQIIKVVKVVDQYGYVLTKRGSGNEYVKKLSTAGETVYGQIGDTIYVNPAVDTQTITVTFTSTPTDTIVRGSGSFADDGFVAGMKIYVTDSAESANNSVWTITNVVDLTLTISEDLTSSVSDEVDIGLAYKIRCYEALPTFTWSASSISNIAIKDSFRPAIRYLVLSDVYSIDKYGVRDQAKASEYERKAKKEVGVLLQNELQYKEQV